MKTQMKQWRHWNVTSKESTSEHLGTVLVTLLFLAPIIVVSGQSVALSGESDLMDTDMDGIDDRIDVLDDDPRIHSFGTRHFDAWPDWRHETISLSESVDKTLFLPTSKDTKAMTLLIGNRSIWKISGSQLLEVSSMESDVNIVAAAAIRLGPDEPWSVIVSSDVPDIRMLNEDDENQWISSTLGNTTTTVHDLAVGDIDNDGFPDVVAMYDNGTAEVWDNVAGDLRITPVMTIQGYDCEARASCSKPVTWTFNDMDRDGDVDMMSGWRNGDLVLHVRNARGEWEDSLLRDGTALDEWPDPIKSVICTDIDGTGYDDLVVVSDVLLEIWINEGYTFNRSKALQIYDIEEAGVLHIEGEQDVHLIVRHEDGRVGHGSISDGISWSSTNNAKSLSTFDHGEDGDVDVIIVLDDVIHIHENGPGIGEILRRATPVLLIIAGIIIYAFHTQWRYNRTMRKK